MSENAKSTADPRNRFRTALWLMLAGVPLAVAPGLFLAHDLTPKLLVLGASACLCLASIGEWYPGLVLLGRRRLGRIYLCAVLLQAASLIVSSLTSRHIALSLEGTIWRRYGLATQLTVLLLGLACGGYFARHPERLRRSLAPLLTAGCLIAAFGIGQYFGADFLFDRRLYTSEYFSLVRPPGTLGHAMYFAAFLLPVVFIAAALLLEGAGKGMRVVLLGGVLLAIGAIVLSGTRSAILGLLAGGLVFGMRNRARIGRRRALLAGAAMAILALGFVGFSFTGGGFGLQRGFNRWMQDSRGGPRLMMWRESLDLIGRHPLLGTGPETFAQEFRSIESAALARAYPDFYLESPHNLALEIGLAQGGPGWLAFALLFGAGLYGGWTVTGAFEPLAVGLLSSLVAMLAAFQFMPLTVANAVCLFAVAGMLTGLVCTSPGAPLPRTPYARPVTAAATAVLAAAALLFAIQDWLFARAGEAIRKGDLAAAAAQYDAVKRLPFPRAGQDLWLSRQFAAAAAGQQPGLPALRLAAEASYRAERYGEEPFNAGYQSAALAIAAGDLKLGEEKLRAVLQLAPTWYKPHMLLAETLLLRGRTEEGKAQAGEAIDLAGSRKEETQRTIQDLVEAMARQNPRAEN